MGDYDYLMSFWKDRRTGLVHASLRGTVWPSETYRQISSEEYHKLKAEQAKNDKARTNDTSNS